MQQLLCHMLDLSFQEQRQEKVIEEDRNIHSPVKENYALQ